MRVVITICSRQKNESTDPLPAKERYLGEHIRKAARVAHDLTSPFFILSGKYGLLEADEKIPNYDHPLAHASAELIGTVAAQLKEHGITEIDFYTEGEEAWMPYQEVLERASELTDIPLNIHQLV